MRSKEAIQRARVRTLKYYHKKRAENPELMRAIQREKTKKYRQSEKIERRGTQEGL